VNIKETTSIEYLIKLAAAGARGESIQVHVTNWMEILQLGAEHNVIPLIACAVKDSPAIECPDQIRDYLLNAMRSSASLNMIRRQRIMHLIRELKAERIPVMILKGYAISDCYAYPDCRESVDTDLLINIKQEKQACALFEKHGFRVRPREATSQHVICQHAKYGMVELHVKLYAPGAGVRLLARLVDMTLYTTLVYTLVYIFQIAYTPYLLPGSPMFWLGMIVLEAFCLRIFGTTPGKKLLHIYVVELSADGLSGVSPMRAFARSFMVFVGGLGMMISFLPLIMGGISLYMLRKRGITSWDARTETHPVQVMRPHGARFLLAVVILFSCLQMISLLFQPWFGPIIQDMERYAPEQAAMLRSFLPQEAVPSPAPVQAEPSATEGGLRFLEL